jgi:hypothetical protein
MQEGSEGRSTLAWKDRRSAIGTAHLDEWLSPDDNRSFSGPIVTQDCLLAQASL